MYNCLFIIKLKLLVAAERHNNLLSRSLIYSDCRGV